MYLSVIKTKNMPKTERTSFPGLVQSTGRSFHLYAAMTRLNSCANGKDGEKEEKREMERKRKRVSHCFVYKGLYERVIRMSLYLTRFKVKHVLRTT